MRAEFSLQSLYPRRSICLRVLWGYCSFGAGYAGNRALPSWCETPFLPSLRITVGGRLSVSDTPVKKQLCTCKKFQVGVLFRGHIRAKLPKLRICLL